MVKNLFGDLALDTTIKSILDKFGRFSFDSSSALRATVTSLPTLATVTTVGTVTTANTSIGDAGKSGTVILMSELAFQNAIGKNFSRIGVGEW